MQAYQQEFPPEIQFINDLLTLESEAEQRQMLKDNQDVVGPEFLEMIKAIRANIGEEEEEMLSERLAAIERMVQTQLLVA
jgi:hypothetical protein